MTVRVFPSQNRKTVVFSDGVGREKVMFFPLEATYPEIMAEVEKWLIA